jgi:SAM-dependent methyltransferase
MILRKLAFHEALGVLNVGDLHPGGAAVSEYLVSEIERIRPRRVLEVGAGIGFTTARMLKRGWNVTPLEPSDVLRRRLRRRVGFTVAPVRFESFEAEAGSFDAVIGESAFYGMDMASAFAKVHALLRRGGIFASLDMLWTEKAEAPVAARIHDDTKRIFGIPMASRVVVTWSDWRKLMRAAGFEEIEARRLPPGSLYADWKTKLTILASAPWHPVAFAQYLKHRYLALASRVPAGWTETWMALWRRI